jgi:uncharacterized protein
LHRYGPLMTPVSSRRHFFRQAALVSLAFGALQRASGQSTSAAAEAPLKKDTKRILDLPPGFKYQVISRMGDPMDDGLRVPGAPDGMGAFEGKNGRTILIRNHELDAGAVNNSAFTAKLALLPKVKKASLYDAGKGKKPGLGGTSTLVFDTKTQKLERQFMSLAGTYRNCAGGITPWGSWITCEEDTSRPNESGQSPDDPMEKEHGYNFEVPASAEIGLADPLPLRAMGRFRHEAVAVDPDSGIVYQTEDRSDGIFYRFIPKTKGRLSDGGKLQALRVKDQPRCDTRNFTEARFKPGDKVAVEWVEVRDVESPDDDLRYQGFFENGAARFARAEGIWYGQKAVHFACTNGGTARKGQIWRYFPSPAEGANGEAAQPGQLELFIEPNDGNLVENCDNVTLAPWGDLIICEDGKNPQYLVGVTAEGKTYQFARTTLGEFAGACFSPDGSTLFVNIMAPGVTLAITGPWAKLRESKLA